MKNSKEKWRRRNFGKMAITKYERYEVVGTKSEVHYNRYLRLKKEGE